MEQLDGFWAVFADRWLVAVAAGVLMGAIVIANAFEDISVVVPNAARFARRIALFTGLLAVVFYGGQLTYSGLSEGLAVGDSIARVLLWAVFAAGLGLGTYVGIRLRWRLRKRSIVKTHSED